MDGLTFQGWTTLSLVSGQTIVQSPHDWLELPNHEDVALHIQVAEADAGLTLTYETSFSRESSTFLALGVITLSAGQRQSSGRSALNHTPVARWIRWHVSATANGACTFRLLLAAYSMHDGDEREESPGAW